VEGHEVRAYHGAGRADAQGRRHEAFQQVKLRRRWI